jgi:hypothetical protein
MDRGPDAERWQEKEEEENKKEGKKKKNKEEKEKKKQEEEDINMHTIHQHCSPDKSMIWGSC